MTYDEQIRRVEEENTRLRAFCTALFDVTDWPGGGDVDLITVQDLAVTHGILTKETRTEPCGDNCGCAEYYGRDEMAPGVECFRKPAWMVTCDLCNSTGGLHTNDCPAAIAADLETPK